MMYLDNSFDYYKRYKDTSVLHYEYADEENGTIPNVEIATNILNDNLGDMTDWCNENLEGEWFWDFNSDIKRGTTRDTIFYFEKRNDAITFRLIWG